MAGAVVAAGDVDACVIEPPVVGDSPPRHAVRAAAPMIATKVIFTTKTFLRGCEPRTRAAVRGKPNSFLFGVILQER
jgi:hypothetical protein